MPVYYKRDWDGSRGDEYSDWGTSVWFFEVGDDDFPTRQIEVYQSGATLRYDQEHLEDELGRLSLAPLDPEDFLPYVITAEEFETAWRKGGGGVQSA